MAQLIACPECDKQLQVPEDLLSKHVQCPSCQHTFVAASKDVSERPDEKRSGVSSKRSNKGEDAMVRPSRDRDDEESDADRGGRRSRFRCPFCGSRELPDTRSQISAAGWVGFVVMLLFCFPFFWVGLLIKEEYRVCQECGSKLG